jgi:hypothetical protein
MAGEKKGYIFEILTLKALEVLGYKLDENLHWGKRPKGFSMDPDFLLGPLEHPTHWLLLTSSTSAKNTTEKFWRNVGELFEARLKFGAKIIDLVFEGKQMEDLQEAMTFLCDADLRVEEKPYGQELLQFVDSVVSKIPSERDHSVAFIKNNLDKSTNGSIAFSSYTNDIKEAIHTANSSNSDEMLSLVHLESSARKTKRSRRTFLRRGLAKLLVCESEHRQKLYQHFQKDHTFSFEDADYLLQLGYIIKTVRGYSVVDEELLWLLNNFECSTLEYLIDKSPLDRLEWWINPLRNLDRIGHLRSYVVRHLESLQTAEGMYQELSMIAQNPNACFAKPIFQETATNWLYYFIFDILKAHSGKHQGYGFTFLLAALRNMKTSINDWLLSSNSGELVIRGQDAIRRGLKDWANRKNSTHAKSFSDTFKKAVAYVLCDELSKLTVNDIPSTDKLTAFMMVSLFDQKLASYPEFEPLPYLIERALSEAKIDFKRVKNHASFIGEAINKPERSATTSVILARNTLIYWKSAYDKGRNHKTKELCGRISGLRFRVEGGRIIRRPGYIKFCLVIDGTFNSEQIISLYEAGWDEVFYTDELDKLTAAVI